MSVIGYWLLVVGCQPLHLPPLLNTTHHPQTRANRRKDGNQRLNHDFPNLFLSHNFYFEFRFLRFTFF